MKPEEYQRFLLRMSWFSKKTRDAVKEGAKEGFDSSLEDNFPEAKLAKDGFMMGYNTANPDRMEKKAYEAASNKWSEGNPDRDEYKRRADKDIQDFRKETEDEPLFQAFGTGIMKLAKWFGGPSR